VFWETRTETRAAGRLSKQFLSGARATVAGVDGGEGFFVAAGMVEGFGWDDERGNVWELLVLVLVLVVKVGEAKTSVYCMCFVVEQNADHCCKWVSIPPLLRRVPGSL
jgi:hypothetical protein